MDGGAGGEIGPWEDFEVGIIEGGKAVASSSFPRGCIDMQRDGAHLEIGGCCRHTDCDPVAPLSRRFGRRAGRTVGSCSESSKFGWKATVSLSMSSSMWAAILPRRDSVYLIAAGGSPSMEPKFP